MVIPVFALVVVIAIYCVDQINALQSLCTPSNAGELDGFLLHQLRMARSELKLPISINDFEMPAMKHVFNHNIGARCYEFQSKRICFVPIEKCAHSSIYANLFNHMELIKGEFVQVFKILRMSSPPDLGLLYNGSKLLPLTRGNTRFAIFHEPPLLSLGVSHDHIPTFTFVRDPLEKFSSGFAEATFWHLRLPKRPFEDIKRNYSVNNITVADVEFILKNFFSFNRNIDFLLAIEHMYTMSGVLFSFDIDIVGHLDAFDATWNSQINSLLMNGTHFNTSLGLHMVTTGKHSKGKTAAVDPWGSHTALSTLFKSKPEYLRAVCQYILIDYVCLPQYRLPESCRDLEVEVLAAQELLRRSNDDKMREKSKVDAAVRPHQQYIPANPIEKNPVTRLQFGSAAERKQLSNQTNRHHNFCYGRFHQMMPFLVTQMIKSMNEMSLDTSKYSGDASTLTMAFRSIAGMELYPLDAQMPSQLRNPFGFAKMWSVGSDIMESNILRAIDLPNSTPAQRYKLATIGREVFYSENELERFLNKRFDDPHFKSDIAFPRKPVTFTMVKDPWKRLLDGIHESIESYFYILDSSIEVIATVIRDVFSPEGISKARLLPNVIRMLPMSGTLFEFNLNIIVHWEDIDSEWRDKLAPILGSNSTWHPRSIARSDGQYLESTRNRNNVTADIERLLSDTPHFRRALCHFVMIDYICLPNYALPAACREFREERLEGLKLLHSTGHTLK
jgi:hypothetical protein